MEEKRSENYTGDTHGNKKYPSMRTMDYSGSTLRGSNHDKQPLKRNFKKRDYSPLPSKGRNHPEFLYKHENFTKSRESKNSYSYTYNKMPFKANPEGQNKSHRVLPVNLEHDSKQDKSPIRQFRQHLSKLEEKLSSQSYTYSYQQSQNMLINSADQTHSESILFERELDECKKAVFMLKDEFEQLNVAFENRVQRKKVQWRKEIKRELELEFKAKFKNYDIEIEKRRYDFGKIERLLQEKDSEIGALKAKLDEYGNSMIDMKNRNISLLQHMDKVKTMQRGYLEKVERSFRQRGFDMRKQLDIGIEENNLKIKRIRTKLYTLRGLVDRRLITRDRNRDNKLKSEIQFLIKEKDNLARELDYEREHSKKLKYENNKLRDRARGLISDIEKMKNKADCASGEGMKDGKLALLSNSG